MRFLAGVCPIVYRQGTSLDEGLSTIEVTARVWPLIRVYPVVPLQVRLAIEALENPQGPARSVRHLTHT